MIFWKWQLCCASFSGSPKNIPDRQQYVNLKKSQKGLNHSTVLESDMKSENNFCFIFQAKNHLIFLSQSNFVMFHGVFTRSLGEKIRPNTYCIHSMLTYFGLVSPIQRWNVTEGLSSLIIFWWGEVPIEWLLKKAPHTHQPLPQIYNSFLSQTNQTIELIT